MTGFELRASRVGSNRSTNWAATSTLKGNPTQLFVWHESHSSSKAALPLSALLWKMIWQMVLVHAILFTALYVLHKGRKTFSLSLSLSFSLFLSNVVVYICKVKTFFAILQIISNNTCSFSPTTCANKALKFFPKCEYRTNMFNKMGHQRSLFKTFYLTRLLFLQFLPFGKCW